MMTKSWKLVMGFVAFVQCFSLVHSAIIPYQMLMLGAFSHASTMSCTCRKGNERMSEARGFQQHEDMINHVNSKP